MKIVIIEDELPSSRRLERMLSDFEFEILTTLVSVKSAVKWFQQNEHPEILFLDIHLSDGLCFEIFKQVEVKSAIVFTTAYSQYSIEAFDYNSIAYLLKPIKTALLEKAIKKASTFYTYEKELMELREVIENNNIAQYKTNFTVRIGNKLKNIEVAKIECFFSEANTTYLRSNSFNYILNSSLISIEDEINSKDFFKVNRMCIVNKSAIKDIISYSNSRLQIQLKTYNESEIIVSRERVKEFKKWIG